GEAERFLTVLDAYRSAPAITRERMHIEALEDILGEVELILLDDEAVGNQVLPLLPLTDPGQPALTPTNSSLNPGSSNQAQGGQ
ncbi:MAG: protease modulator HflK, partial [Chloroflexota bacterium]